jgi:hypothetical protein
MTQNLTLVAPRFGTVHVFSPQKTKEILKQVSSDASKNAQQELQNTTGFLPVMFKLLKLMNTLPQQVAPLFDKLREITGDQDIVAPASLQQTLASLVLSKGKPQQADNSTVENIQITDGRHIVVTREDLVALRTPQYQSLTLSPAALKALKAQGDNTVLADAFLAERKAAGAEIKEYQ